MVDFAADPEGAASEINALVSEQTNNNINNLLGDLSPDTDFVITNAVYFDGIWEQRFKEKLVTQSFFLADNTEVPAEYMTKQIRITRVWICSRRELRICGRSVCW